MPYALNSTTGFVTKQSLEKDKFMNVNRVLLSLLVGVVVFAILPVTTPRIWASDEEAAAEKTAPDETVEVVVVEEEEAPAEEESTPITFKENPDASNVGYAVDNIMLFLCAVLVLFMQAGFAMVEAGFNSSKNAVNILFKNLMDLCIGALLFWLIGYNLMYPGGDFEGPNGFFGINPEKIGRPEAYDPGSRFHPQVDFLFQVAFAATAATIVSGAVAGRLKFPAYLIYSVVITAFVYPISGSWKWGLGWLDAQGFHDFAGSLVVHAVGGFAGLAGAMVLGPRIGRYSEDGKSQPILGHNLSLATLGVFVLLVGWFGFNPGSVLAFSDAASTGTTMIVAVNTLLAACAGGFVAMIASWVTYKKPDLSMALNGVLAGLVGITANADVVTNPESIVIGGVAGVLVLLGVVALDKLKIDDPVGAFPVHGLCGFWGGVATGIFGEGKVLVTQIWASAVICAWAFITMFILFSFLKSINLLRVSPEEEIGGLDVHEHGMPAYQP